MCGGSMRGYMITVKRFTAPWCAPCRMLSPLFKQMEEDIKDVTFETIDVDENPLMAEMHSVRSVPTVLIYKNEEKISSYIGAGSKKEYMDLIEEARNA